jgi:hypothetical protein
MFCHIFIQAVSKYVIPAECISSEENNHAVSAFSAVKVGIFIRSSEAVAPEGATRRVAVSCSPHNAILVVN